MNQVFKYAAIATMSALPFGTFADTHIFDTPTLVNELAEPRGFKTLELDVVEEGFAEDFTLSLTLTGAEFVNAALITPDGFLGGRAVGPINNEPDSATTVADFDFSLPDTLAGGTWQLIIIANGGSLEAPVTLENWSLTFGDDNDPTEPDEPDQPEPEPDDIVIAVDPNEVSFSGDCNGQVLVGGENNIDIVLDQAISIEALEGNPEFAKCLIEFPVALPDGFRISESKVNFNGEGVVNDERGSRGDVILHHAASRSSGRAAHVKIEPTGSVEQFNIEKATRINGASDCGGTTELKTALIMFARNGSISITDGQTNLTLEACE